ncbi:hypothetical protein cce_2956 [Crocosphaera subtropica ATCC 51142]|uniref:Uncharacterized protein n=1 Tax=Crocosphaera subtropica (strain ATCC 51142 / BH68) TaxID=43989 RepID=B1WVX1_CROS5|nr:hypothetical protein cce_2956 [Crocosphaera subtropica ATCC 51142]
MLRGENRFLSLKKSPIPPREGKFKDQELWYR